MQSPFPGMDPFLEVPSGWPTFHHWLLSVMSELIITQITPNYVLKVEERVYIVDDVEPYERQTIAPDIFLVQSPTAPTLQVAAPATATPATIIERLPSVPDVRDRYLTIYDRRSRELVTIIEVLSPWNKARGSRGNREFLAKREAVFATRTHWIEIDLLRAGERPEEVAGQSDYYVLLRRGNAHGRLAVWYVDVRDALPCIVVPLREPNSDVVLDLQAAFATIYQRARYADDVDYSQPVPPPPLRPATAAWVGQRVAAWREG